MSKRNQLVPLTPEQQALVEKHMGIVYRYVRSRWFLKRHRQEFVQIGMLGLIRAVKGFREGNGYAIETYCLFRIRGAIANHIDAWRMIQPPKGYRRESEAELDKIMSVVHVESITDMLTDRGARFDPVADDRRGAKDVEIDVSEAIDRLDPIQAKVIKACCIGGRDMKSFGLENGIPKTTVRAHRERGFDALRSTLRHYSPTAS